MADIDEILLKYVCVYEYRCHEVALYLYRLLKTESLVIFCKNENLIYIKKKIKQTNKNLVCKKTKKVNSS